MGYGGTWTLDNVNLGNMNNIGQNYATQASEQSIWGQTVDDVYIYSMGGPTGRITINTERRNPETPTSTNPSNANFIQHIESIINTPLPSWRGPSILRLIPSDSSQYPSRFYYVFLNGATHNWATAHSPEVITFSFNFTRRRPSY